MAASMPEAPTMWLTYVQVKNLDASLARVGELGGQICVPKTPFPGRPLRGHPGSHRRYHRNLGARGAGVAPPADYSSSGISKGRPVSSRVLRPERIGGQPSRVSSKVSVSPSNSSCFTVSLTVSPKGSKR